MKKNNKKNYIDKGIYSHPQIGGYLSLKQFILIEQDGKRCLLLRFANESDFEINAARFIVKQLNAEGEEIGRVDMEYREMDLSAGQMYSPEQGIVVKKECVDFTVQPIWLVSGDYKYVFRNGTVNASYDPRGYGEKQRADRKRGSAGISIRQSYRGGGKIYGVIAAVSFILVIGSLIFVIYQSAEGMARDELPKTYSEAYADEL